MSKMAERIHNERLKANLSQEELGKKLNPPVTRQSVSRWEQGSTADIKRSHIAQMANIFNVSPVYLMGYENSDKVQLTYTAPNADSVTVHVDQNPIIGESSKIAMIYDAVLKIKPENMDLALKILKTLQ